MKLTNSYRQNFLKATLLDAIRIIAMYATYEKRPAERLKDIADLLDYAADRKRVDIDKILEKYGISLGKQHSS